MHPVATWLDGLLQTRLALLSAHPTNHYNSLTCTAGESEVLLQLPIRDIPEPRRADQDPSVEAEPRSKQATLTKCKEATCDDVSLLSFA